jgi:Acetyltransferase (GNAT) domain
MDKQKKEMNLSFSKISHSNLNDYERLLSEVFKRPHLNFEYLQWLYFMNPNGNVVGFDAYLGNDLVGHYACIPISIDEYSSPALLSVNTVIDPGQQRTGLFKTLAEMTYTESSKEYACVIGVANANSFRGFTRHLGFEHIGDLELRFGSLRREPIGQRVFSNDEISWRVQSPHIRLYSKILKSQSSLKISHRIFGPFKLSAIAKSKDLHASRQLGRHLPKYGLTLDWRKGKKPLIFLPRKFKPSPLHLIFKPLNEKACKVTSWSFPDFDAF